MKNKPNEPKTSRPVKSPAETPDNSNNLQNETTGRSNMSRQRQNAYPDQEIINKILSKGYNPDGPGGNYRGV